MNKILLVFLGGGIGSICRFLISNFMLQKIGTNFPYGTLTANLLGCFLIGLLAGLPQGITTLNPAMKILLIVGFLGGFTTFSSYEFESFLLITEQEYQKAFINLISSVILGFIFLGLGFLLMRLITKN